MPTTARTRTDIKQAASGAAFELVWSDDDTMVRLRLFSKDGRSASMLMPTTDLDELRRFLNERIE